MKATKFCPEAEEVNTFKEGCLFGESSINCVVGKEYTSGSGACTGYLVTYHMGDFHHMESSQDGYFDEETQMWHFTTTTTMFDYSTPMFSASREIVLERVEE